MASASGRFIVVFNGEIYNAPALRTELMNRGLRAWRGHSDTEVMLGAFDAWGVLEATKRFDGMFAIAVYDAQEHTLHLVRDRVGKKPLYFGWVGSTFAFASELKALRCLPGAQLEVDRDAVAQMLRFGHIPGPSSIYRGIAKLQPGQIATLRVGSSHAGGSGVTPGTAPTIETYWSAARVAEAGVAHQLDDSTHGLVNQLESHLERAVRARMISDVPLGAFLSGGIDSALVVAMMARVSAAPIETFTIGFEDARYDESAAALEISRALRTKHHTLRATARDAMAVIPSLASIYDEPFADSSQIPTAMLSALARSNVTVVLSGDGGDELFGGYDRYVFAPQIWKSLHNAPPWLRAIARSFTAADGKSRRGILAQAVRLVMPPWSRSDRMSEKICRIAPLLNERTFAGAYRALAQTSDHCDGLVLGATAAPTDASAHLWQANLTDLSAQMMQRDLVTYLVDDILVKVDRASMSVGLEVRSPMLDHHLIEWAWRLPMSAKIRGGKGKVIARELAARLFPGGLSQQPKRGFGVPIAEWLRGDLREWAEDLVSHDRLARDGFLDPVATRALWASFLRGQQIDQHLIWAILMFQSWLDGGREAGG